MGQIKKLDVAGFESRVDSHSLNMARFDTFLKADRALVEADAILSECGIEGITPIGYESRAGKIGKLSEDASLLLKYPDELIDGLQAVDSAFAKGVQKATEALSTIRIDDIRIKNTFDKEIIGQSENQETSESTLKEYLTMEDVVRSFDELSPQETSFVKEFTDLLYAPYATKNIALDAMVTEKEDELQELLNGSDHDADKYHPAKEFLREILGVLTSGNYSSSIASMGYDPITKDVLSEEERKNYHLSGLRNALTLGADTKLDELIAYISKPQGWMASLLSSNSYEAMAVSRLETYLLTATSGVAVGYSLAKDGMSFLDFYQKHRQKILQNMAKGTSSRVPAYSTSISANQQNIADPKIDEDALKGAKVLEYKLSLITKEDGSLKYTEKEIQEMIDYVLRKYPISLSSLYHIPSQYYPNQMEICLQHAFEAKQMIPIEKGADLFEDYLRNLKDEDGTPMYTKSEIEEMSSYLLDKHASSLSNLYYAPSQYYKYAAEQCLAYIEIGKIKDLMVGSGWDDNYVSDDMVADLYRIMKKYDITSQEQVCAFISQCMLESDHGRGLMEYGDEAYFDKQGYGLKYRGCGYIHLTGKRNYTHFATYMILQKYPRLEKYTSSSKGVFDNYNNIVNAAAELNIDISKYTSIVDKGAKYVADNYAWESAGYFWDYNKLNNRIISGTIDNISKAINGERCQSLDIRRSNYEKTLLIYDQIFSETDS